MTLCLITVLFREDSSLKLQLCEAYQYCEEGKNIQNVPLCWFSSYVTSCPNKTYQNFVSISSISVNQSTKQALCHISSVKDWSGIRAATNDCVHYWLINYTINSQRQQKMLLRFLQSPMWCFEIISLPPKIVIKFQNFSCNVRKVEEKKKMLTFKKMKPTNAGYTWNDYLIITNSQN